MLVKKKLWVILVLCLAAFLWKMYRCVHTGLFSDSSEQWSSLDSFLEQRICNCNRCIDHNPQDWFCDHYDASVNCLLTRESQRIPPEVLFWWLTSQAENVISIFRGNNKEGILAVVSANPLHEKICFFGTCVKSKNFAIPHFFCSFPMLETFCSISKKLQRSQDGKQVQKIIKHLFEILPSSTAKVQHTSQCGTCAVVGNSGRLKGSKYGENIDSHHFVLRINTAPTAGFEEDVGAKTTHHFMYPESAMNLHAGVHLMLVPFKPLDLKWLASAFSSGEIQHTYRRVKQFVEADKSKVQIINPAFLKYIQDKWTKHHGRYPSTGFTALIFAIHTCTQVSAFGFGADNNGNWHHYWEENHYAGAFRKTGVHDANFELGLIERLADEGKVLFYK